MRKLRPALRAYVLAVIALGVTAVALAAASVAMAMPRADDLVLAAALCAIAIPIQMRPVHLSPKVKMTVDDTITFAAVLTLGVPLAVLVGAISTLVGLRVGNRSSWYSRAFNASTMGLGQAAGAGAFLALGGPGRTVLDVPVAVVAAAVAKFAVASSLTEIVVALQLRRAPFASWWRIHQRDLPYQAGLYVLGVLAAMAARIHVAALLLFVLPLVAVLGAIRETARMRDRTIEAIFKLADLVDLRDPYTHGHSVRVASLAERLAKRLRLEHSQIELVTIAARVHDIGKVGTDDHVLLKPGPLDEAELVEMHKHSDHGAELLAILPEFWEGAELVRAHHERTDGHGYPRGLAGSELPLEASIIACVDAYDAMTSDRPYRAGMSWEAARAELLRHRGTQWPGRVVDAFISMMEEGRAEGSPSPRLAAGVAATT